MWLDWVDILVYAMEKNRRAKMVCDGQGDLTVQDCNEYAQRYGAILHPESDDSCQDGLLTPGIPDEEEHDKEYSDAPEVCAQGQESC